MKAKTNKSYFNYIFGLILSFSSIYSWADKPAQLFSGPEVFKLDWNTRALVHFDIDNNGAEDLILLNNERTRIEILYQKRSDLKRQLLLKKKQWQPILEDSRFSRKNIVTGTTMNALVVGDLNHDGLADLAYTSKTYGLSLLFQQPKDKWSAARHINYIQPSKNSSSLVISDLNADGAQDLVLLGEKELLVFYQTEDGKFKIPHRYPFADRNHFSLIISDVDQDKRADIIYLAKNSRFALRVRIQNNDESFGSEQIFPLLTPTNKLILFNPDSSTTTGLAYIENKTQQLLWGKFSVYSEKKSKNKDTPPTQLALPHVYPLPFKKIKAANYATGDINGDKFQDIIAADFKGAQVWLYQQLNNGQFSRPIAFPSFSGIQSITMADLDQDNIDELYLVSKTEKIIGVSRIIDNKRLSYPKVVEFNSKENMGVPITLANIKLKKEKIPALVSLIKQKQQRQVLISTYTESTKKLEIKQTLNIKKLNIDPSGIKTIDINQDGLDDLILFILHNPAIVLLQTEQGLFKQLSSINFRQGLLDNLKQASLTLGDINQDGNKELLIAGKGYARAMRSNSKQQLEIIEQYNAINKNAQITSILPFDIDADGQNEMLIYQQGSEQIDILKKDENGVYRPFNNLASGKIDILDSKIFSHNNSQKRALYLGKDRFWVLPIGAQKLNFKIQQRYESTLAEVKYQKLASGDINNDSKNDIIALDSKHTHIAEFISTQGSSWKSLLHFEVFDTQSSSKDSLGSSNEPRELLISDINGDDKNDLIFLVHDRILLYLGR
ncbi:MAG: VCBS repeat-containing protein [Pseudomonadota bacterium]